ncbi:MAG: hypothetical protein HQM15_10985 [Deltaproteobacteria bacterium]|nr:hypothetical protein [Deltaproteobacteria bacterium]
MTKISPLLPHTNTGFFLEKPQSCPSPEEECGTIPVDSFQDQRNAQLRHAPLPITVSVNPLNFSPSPININDRCNSPFAQGQSTFTIHNTGNGALSLRLQSILHFDLPNSGIRSAVGAPCTRFPWETWPAPQMAGRSDIRLAFSPSNPLIHPGETIRIHVIYTAIDGSSVDLPTGFRGNIQIRASGSASVLTLPVSGSFTR